MFSNHINKRILTDSHTILLIELYIERTLKIIMQNTEPFKDIKSVDLNYEVLNCQSPGLILGDGLISFIYGAFIVNHSRPNEIKRRLGTIFIR